MHIIYNNIMLRTHPNARTYMRAQVYIGLQCIIRWWYLFNERL